MTIDELERLAKAWMGERGRAAHADDWADAQLEMRWAMFTSPERILAMIECIRAARAMRAEMDQVPPTGLERRLLHAFDIANAKLDEVLK